MAILADAKTKFGELPKPTLVRKVDVVVAEADADELYDYIYEKAHIGRPRGGAIWLSALSLTSPFALLGGCAGRKILAPVELRCRAANSRA